jgi:hypothetical protein
MKNWHGIMKILEINHLNKKGDVIYEEKNIKNMLHITGEDFVLKSLFTGQQIPNNYYLGLDSRSLLSFTDTISNLFGAEPAANGYGRQSIPYNNFSIIELNNGHKQANSPTVLFKAIGGQWGPVKNIFLSTGLGYGSNAVLISSASLSNTITVSDGEIVTMKMGMLLSNC